MKFQGTRLRPLRRRLSPWQRMVRDERIVNRLLRESPTPNLPPVRTRLCAMFFRETV